MRHIAMRGAERRFKRVVTARLVVVIAAWLPVTHVLAQACPPVSGTERVSIATDGAQGNDRSLIPATNVDGCIVAFKSSASNLIATDFNDKVDIFVRDRGAATTARVTVSVGAPQPNDNSFPPALSSDGRFVAFASQANNLVIGDFNQTPDVFVFDRQTDTTEVLTLTLGGDAGGGAPDLPPSVNADGRFVAFASQADNLVPLDSNETTDVFVRERASGVTELVSVVTAGGQQGRSGNGPSAGAAITADGCVVAFYSDATNLVAGDRNEFRDVFVRDRCAGFTERVSVASDGSEANGPSEVAGLPPAISGDGRFVAFASDATNLVPDDTNGVTDIFIRDRQSGTTTRVQPPSGCGSGGAAALEATGFSDAPSFSDDGRFLAFVSLSSSFVGNDTNGLADVFVFDRLTGVMARVLGDGDVEPNGAAGFPQMSRDGRVVVYQSDASNLVAGDTNGVTDIFISGNPFLSGEPIPGVTPLPTCTPTETPVSPTAAASATATPTASRTSTFTSGIPTRTRTPTATMSFCVCPTNTGTPTPTAGAFCESSCSIGETCRVEVAGQVEPGRCDPSQGCRCVPAITPVPPTLTATPVRTPTATVTTTTGAHGGHGGGCGCRIDPHTGAVAYDSVVPALSLPALLWVWRRRTTPRKGLRREA